MAEFPKGRNVWVQDPALKEDQVFFKGTVQASDQKTVKAPSRTTTLWLASQNVPNGPQVTVQPAAGGSASTWKLDQLMLVSLRVASPAIVFYIQFPPAVTITGSLALRFQACTNVDDVKDHTMLDCLNQATVLENTRQRFAAVRCCLSNH